jgi:hypothetical protein
LLTTATAPQKHVWRARILLATADGLGTAAIMRTAGDSKTAVWRWQARLMEEGVPPSSAERKKNCRPRTQAAGALNG